MKDFENFIKGKESTNTLLAGYVVDEDMATRILKQFSFVPRLSFVEWYRKAQQQTITIPPALPQPTDHPAAAVELNTQRLVVLSRSDIPDDGDLEEALFAAKEQIAKSFLLKLEESVLGVGRSEDHD